MGPLDLVRLTPLMDRTSGRPEVRVGLIDGPVALDLPDFSASLIREIPGQIKGACSRTDALACSHGTFVAAILAARRGSFAPAICPGCTLLLRPIFSENTSDRGVIPSATPEELAAAIFETVDAGVHVLNLSSAIVRPTPRGARMVEDALNYAAHRGVIAVAAAGNQASVGSTVITGHPWVLPVAACNPQGLPLNDSNLGGSIGRRGLSAPGERVTSLGPDGKPQTFDGTSAAAPFVAGAVALLWSEFPGASTAEIKLAVTRSVNSSRASITPPLLDAWAAYQAMQSRASEHTQLRYPNAVHKARVHAGAT